MAAVSLVCSVSHGTSTHSSSTFGCAASYCAARVLMYDVNLGLRLIVQNSTWILRGEASSPQPTSAPAMSTQRARRTTRAAAVTLVSWDGPALLIASASLSRGAAAHPGRVRAPARA